MNFYFLATFCTFMFSLIFSSIYLVTLPNKNIIIKNYKVSFYSLKSSEKRGDLKYVNRLTRMQSESSEMSEATPTSMAGKRKTKKVSN